MRLIRFQTKAEPIQYGWVNDDLVGRIAGSPFGEYQRSEANLPLESSDSPPPDNSWQDYLCRS